MKNLIGSTIQQYQILVKIRETGTRILYRAYDPQTRQNVGLEVIRIPIKDNASLLELINEQAKKNGDLDHPNIAAVIDSGIHEDMIYLVYNFSPAHPLRRFFNRTYAWHELARELVSAAQALAYAHQRGIYHGALTPSSIVLNEKRTPFLFDFGFEQIITNHISTHAPGSWINKWGIEYRAPEQLLGYPPDWRSDIYSMGIILYEWLTGEIAFRDATIFETLQKRMSSSPEDLKSEKEISPAIQTMVEKCLAADPAERYQSMQEVGLILARGALDLTITRNMARRPLAPPPPSINGRQTLLSLGLILALVVTIGFFTTKAITSAEQATATAPASTPTKQKTATPQKAISTPTPVPPASTPTKISPPQGGFGNSKFPLFQGTPIAPEGSAIQIANAQRVVPIGLWGIGDLTYLAVSPDNEHIAAASSIGLFVFNAKDLSFQKYTDTLSWVSAIDYSPDGKIIAAGNEDGSIQLWDIDTWESTAIYSGHTGSILDLDFSPDGTMLASVALDGKLIQWDVKSGGQSQTQVQTTTVMNCVTYSSDGQKIITGDNLSVVTTFNIKDLTIDKTFTVGLRVIDLSVFPNSSQVVIADASQKLSVLDLSSINEENRGTVKPLGNMRYNISQIVISPDGSLVAGGDINGDLTVWNSNAKGEWIETWKVQGEVPSNDDIALGKIHSLSFSPDGKLIFSGVRNGILRVFDANTGSEVQQNQSLDAHTEKLVISHDGKYALIQYRNNTLKVWDIANGKPLYSLQGKIIDGGSFSPNDKFLAIAPNASTVKVYTSLDGREVHTFNNNGDIKTIQFIQDGNYLVAGNKGETHLWSMISWQELKTIRNFVTGCPVIQDLNGKEIFQITDYDHVVIDPINHSGLCNFKTTGSMKALYISETNNRLAYGGNSLLIVIDTSATDGQKWDLQEGVNLRKVVGVTISPNGNILATAYDDHTIHLWDVASQKEITNPSGLYGHKNTITDLRITPDGRLLISTSLDGTIRLWGIPY